MSNDDQGNHRCSSGRPCSCTEESEDDPEPEDNDRREFQAMLRELDGRRGPGRLPTSTEASSSAGDEDDVRSRAGNQGDIYSDDVPEWVQNVIEETLRTRREERRRIAEMRSLGSSSSGSFSWADIDVRAFLANEHERKEEEWGTDYRIDFGGHTGKTPSSSEFLRETQGSRPDGMHVNINRFLTLPRHVVEDLIEAMAGGLTWGDAVRVEIPALSYLAGLSAEQPDGPRSIDYAHGVTVAVPDQQIVVSNQTVARALYERFFFSPTPRREINAGGDFDAFYQKVVRAIRRLVEGGYLKHHGPAVDTGDRKSDAYGQRYSIDALDVRSLPAAAPAGTVEFASNHHLPPAEHYVDTFAQEGPNEREIVDVAAMFDRLAIAHTDQWSTFTEQAAKATTAPEDSSQMFQVRERDVDGFSWQRRQARRSTVKRSDGKENSRHVTIGAYKPGYSTHEDRSHMPCAPPFFVLEVDGEMSRLCLEYARRIVRWLKDIDVPLDDVTVTYTGNESFHVRLPAGLFGKPIFRSGREAARTTGQFYSIVQDELDRPSGAHLDKALASPLHHIRAIGSVHEGLYSRQGKTRHCVGFTAEEILRCSLGAIQQYSIWYSGYTLPHPGTAPFHKGLHSLLRVAHEHSARAYDLNDTSYESTGVIDKIRREGVQKGEEFGQGLVGRNLAARLLTLNLIQSGMSVQDAWIALQDWNEKNDPPLGQDSDDYQGELRYVFDKAKEDAPRL